jgi:hypothetical protein
VNSPVAWVIVEANAKALLIQRTSRGGQIHEVCREGIIAKKNHAA